LAHHWLNGTRRAPAWFVAVLSAELGDRIDKLVAIREALKTVETGDRRRSPEARARGRLHRMRQLGRPIGDYRTSDALMANPAEKNEPHN